MSILWEEFEERAREVGARAGGSFYLGVDLAEDAAGGESCVPGLGCGLGGLISMVFVPLQYQSLVVVHQEGKGLTAHSIVSEDGPSLAEKGILR